MPRVDYFKNSEDFVEYAANQVIFDQGDASDAMYAVKEGGHYLRRPLAGHGQRR